MKTKEWYRLSLLAACLLWLSLSLTGCGNASYFETKESGAEAEVSGETDSGDETGGTKGAEQGTGTFGQDPKKQDTDVCYVHVTGAVAHPGVYQLPAGSRVYQAIEMAGGLTEQASEREINLAEGVTDGQKLYIYTREESEALVSSGGGGLVGDIGAENGGTDARVNINTADKEELMTLAGIGESKAEAIIAYREENGGFSSPEDIKNISGIKDGVYSKIKDSICVN